MIKNSIQFCSLFLFVLLSSCSTAPNHPALQNATLPKLIPLRDFIANTQANFNYKVSPDGKKIAWIAIRGTKQLIHFRTIATKKVNIINSRKNVSNFYWAQDSSTVFFHQDNHGDENYHVYQASIQKPKNRAIDITPIKGVRATLEAIPRNDASHVFIKHNKRDKSVFDLFRLDLHTQKLKLVSKNPGKVFDWLIDDSGKLRGRYQKLNATTSRFESLNKNGTWKKVLDWNYDDTFYVVDFTNNPNMIWVVSNIGRDKTALQKFDLNTHKSTIVYTNKQVDLGRVYISKITHQPLFALSSPDYPSLHFFNRSLANEYQNLKKRFKKNIIFLSTDNSERNIVLSVSDEKSASHYLYQRDNRAITLLGKHHLNKYKNILSSTKPIQYKSRDGLTIHGYLTIPKGLEGRRVPMILKVHGGPWARDYYRLNSRTQLLANRGYAVLQVNYRGSSGYGKKFRDAAIGEFARKMHFDLIDGVNWAVSKGIADKNKTCIMGGSYGGYATLVGLTFTPDVFACGVDIVGMSNLVTLTKNAPAYWKPWMPFWYKFVGNPNIPEQRKQMESRSPLFKVNAVTKPLMIVQGANDPRVTQIESDQIVKALRASGKEVEYLLFKDEGHGIKKWTNDLKFNRRLEDFLAKHLGGRSAGFDYYEIGAMIF